MSDNTQLTEALVSISQSLEQIAEHQRAHTALLVEIAYWLGNSESVTTDANYRATLWDKATHLELG